MTEANRIKLTDIARGILQGVPDAHRVNGAAIRMALLRQTSRQSLGQVVETWARKTPRATALTFEKHHWTYAELNAWANRIAAVLSTQGVRPGTSVAILMDNRPAALACTLATVKLGAVAAPLNFHQRGDVLSHSVGLVEPQVLVITAECRDALASAGLGPNDGSSCRYLWHGGDKHDSAPAGWLDLDEAIRAMPATNPSTTRQVRAQDPCFYIFTSGTTGLPKASVMTHYRWLSSMAGLGGATLRLRADDVFYVCLPLYHNNALTVSWGAVLSAGATLALDRKFSASRFWERIRAHQATAFCYIGELLRYLLNQPESPQDRDHHVRLITGNGLRPELWQAFEERFGIQRIYEFYGASESNIAFVNAFGLRQTAGFTPLGFAIVEYDEATEAPVRQAKGRMKRVPRGGVGLLISEVTSGRPFDGYTDDQASEKKLLRDVFKRGDCWFNTGDLVRDQGYRHIQFVDRVGDTYRWKGENVAASEVEGVLAQQPDIEHAIVFGVEVPGHDGRAGMAAITMQPGQSFDGSALADRLRSALPAYAVPVFLRLQTSQDTTGTFKYRKVDLKRAGYDPAGIDDPLYVLTGDGYLPLTQKRLQALMAGALRI